MKNISLISIIIILGMGILLNNCGDNRIPHEPLCHGTQRDSLCHDFCQKFSDCISAYMISELKQCENNCQEEIGKSLSVNACENIINNIEGMDCTGFKRYSSACHDECTTSGAKVCSGNGYLICAYNDSNGCFEYGQVNNCGLNELCSDGDCNKTYPSNITLEINNLCYNGQEVKYRYFGLVSGDVWPSSGFYSFLANENDNNVYSSNITCLVRDKICFGAGFGDSGGWCVGINNQMYGYDSGCCVSCSDGLDYVWSITCN